ncbi:HD domain-containing phosphohydrolase [Fusibacter bizertensis]
MNLDVLRSKIHIQQQKDDEIQQIYEELEAAYQQLLAMQAQLTQNEQRHALFIKNMSDIVWIADTDGKILFINDVVIDILGYHSDEMIGRKLNEFMCPLHVYNTGACQEIVAKMNDLEFLRQEIWMLHKDGRTRKVLEVNTKHYMEDCTLIEIQGVGRDITDRIQIERKIRQKNLQLEFVNEISASITSNLSLDNLDQLLEETCNSIVCTLGVSFCSIRFKDENNLLNLSAVSGKHKDLVSKMPLSVQDPLITSIITNKKSTTVTREIALVAQDNIRNVFHQDMIKEVLILPIISNEESVGIISIGVDKSYDTDFTSMFSTLANNLALAVEKSKLYQSLKSFYFDLILTLVAAIEAKDTYTQGHSLRVSQYSVEIAKQLGMSNLEIEEIKIAGILHDIGKIGISDSILSKPGLLTPEEFERIKQHPQIGLHILEKINLSDNIKSAILYHHLRYDLTGYPEENTIENLPVFARIVGVADAFDAMTSQRSYKQSMTYAEALDELNVCTNTQFCPVVVGALIELLTNNKIDISDFESSELYA